MCTFYGYQEYLSSLATIHHNTGHYTSNIFTWKTCCLIQLKTLFLFQSYFTNVNMFAGEGQDELLDLIVGMQSKRMDEQRVALPHLPGLCPPQGGGAAPDDGFLEMLMRCQGARLEDQRSTLPAEPTRGATVPDEDFFSLIMRLQSGRMEDQRATVPHTLK